MEPIKVEYYIGDDVIDVLRNVLYGIYSRRVDFTKPDIDDKVDVRTGLGGLSKIYKGMNALIATGVLPSTTLVEKNRASICLYTPFLPTLKFCLDVAFDNVKDPDAANIIIDGYRRSSFTYVLIDGITVVAELMCIGKKEQE